MIVPRHKALINKILTSKAHVICTLRTKTDYVLNENSKGKLVTQKVGLKAIQRDGIDYEFTILFEMDINHNASCTKNRTNLFKKDQAFQITESIGKQILDWTKEGVDTEQIIKLINQAKSLDELRLVFDNYTQFYPRLENQFKAKKAELSNILSTVKINNNGLHK